MLKYDCFPLILLILELNSLYQKFMYDYVLIALIPLDLPPSLHSRVDQCVIYAVQYYVNVWHSALRSIIDFTF